jgi:hypothetical protein
MPALLFCLSAGELERQAAIGIAMKLPPDHFDIVAARTATRRALGVRILDVAAGRPNAPERLVSHNALAFETNKIPKDSHS